MVTGMYVAIVVFVVVVGFPHANTSAKGNKLCTPANIATEHCKASDHYAGSVDTL